MTTKLGEIHDWKGKQVLVLGLAKSGIAVAKLLLRYGVNVWVNDRSPRNEANGVEELEALDVSVICGGHPIELLEQHDWYCIIKNPGIPYDIPFLVEAEARSIPILTEVELTSLLTKATVIGITGSNGKTTTSTLTAEILKAASLPTYLAGNIGTVLSEVAEQANDDEYIVAELSSFQLLHTHRFRPHIAILLNLYDAHLNYHHTSQHYHQAKAKLFQNQGPSDYAIINGDQEACRRIADGLQSQVYEISLERALTQGAYVEGKGLWLKQAASPAVHLLDISEIPLPGHHNIQNVLAAALAGFLAGAELSAIRVAIQQFKGVKHRLELVRTWKGITFINDSKATNANATAMAIKSLNQPIILLAGGLDRGEELSSLIPLFTEKVKAVVAYGEIKEKIRDIASQAGVKHIQAVDNVAKAVQAASQLAQTGDNVLLSPAAASWDQFKSYEERGDMFIQSVHMLK